MRQILIGLIIVMSTLALFPTPKLTKLSIEPYLLAQSNECAEFELVLQDDKVLAFMPSSTDKKLETSPGSYYFEKVMQRVRKLAQCRIESSLQTHKVHIKHE